MLFSTLRARARFGFGLAALITVSALSVGPVAAQTEVGHTGVVGFHALKDSENRPGATCTYTERNGSYYWQGDLTRISVRPPRMRAATGNQLVGWRFVIQRRSWDGDFGAWKNKYFSPLQWDTTDTTHDASFTWMGTDIDVPTSNPDASPEYLYRVRVKMFWKNSAGDVTGKAVHEVDWYRLVEMDTYPENYDCRGWQAWEIN
jgi:hypothetical protein